MVKKNKTLFSEQVRKNCTEEAKKAKITAIKENRPFDALKAGFKQTQCEILEDSLKEKRPIKKKRKIITSK